MFKPPGRKNNSELTANEREAANRAEATALLVRSGYRVYRPEADVHGEDLVLRDPTGKFFPVQLKSSAQVDWRRYGGRHLWLLFPDQKGPIPGRRWFLLPHDPFYKWVKERRGRARGWAEAWRYPYITKDVGKYLNKFSNLHWPI